MKATCRPLNAHDPAVLELAHDVLRRVRGCNLRTDEGRADARLAIVEATHGVRVAHLRRVAFALGQGIPATDRATVTRQAADAAILRVMDGNEHPTTAPKTARRHPAEVTASRLAKTMEDFAGSFTTEEWKQAYATVRVLTAIAEGRR